jgi:hypothetical protein
VCGGLVGLGHVDIDVVVGRVVVTGCTHHLGDTFGGGQAVATVTTPVPVLLGSLDVAPVPFSSIIDT